MKTKTARNLLLILLAFLGFGALFGGAVLIISPTGKLFGMPLSMLQSSPFSSFLIPGIVLFVVLGLFPMLVIFGLLKKPNFKWAEQLNSFNDMHWSWTFSIYVAFALIGWIQTEMYFLQAVHWSHSLYMLIGMAIIFTALLPQVRNLYQNEI